MDKFWAYSKTIVGFLIAIVAAVVDVTLVNFMVDVPSWVVGTLRLLETGGGFVGVVGLRASMAEVLRNTIGEDKSPWQSKTILATVILFLALIVDYVLPGFGAGAPPWLDQGLTYLEAIAGSIGIVGLRQAVGRTIKGTATLFILALTCWWLL